MNLCVRFNNTDLIFIYKYLQNSFYLTKVSLAYLICFYDKI